MTVYPTKYYPHFDKIIAYNSKVKSYVEDSRRIEKHSFFPFIEFEKEYKKFVGYNHMNPEINKPIKIKKRPIMYAAHIDNFIYKFYSDMINKKYNIWVNEKGFDKCVTAYRNNKKGRSNIHCAAEVIDFINKSSGCYIMVGDYKKFFDTLEHKYLKQKLKTILKVTTLPLDYYKVLKSVTQYCYISKKYIESYLIQHGKNIKTLTSYFSFSQEFRDLKNKINLKFLLKHNMHTKGVPQGSAISAVLANVYMIDIDEKINSITKTFSGLYRRYSDDFIIVIPKKYSNRENFITIENNVKSIIHESNLNLEENKTILLEFNNNNIYKFVDKMKTKLDYLGFCFDGQSVSIRQKSIYKFYRNAYKCINKAIIRSVKNKSKKLRYRREIYGLYTKLGKYSHSNFLTYADRSINVFKQVNATNYDFSRQIKNCDKKIYYACTNKYNKLKYRLRIL